MLPGALQPSATEPLPAVAEFRLGAPGAVGLGVLGLTVKLAPTPWLSEPLVPVMVNGKVPVVAPDVVVSVRVDELVAGLGLKELPAPPDRPLTLRLTLPANPFWGVIETVKVVPPPWVTVRLDGEMPIEKSGVGGGEPPPRSAPSHTR